jgi:hypothetical protein
MKKTLALSMFAATIVGGMLLTQPAEAYGYHHEWRHSYHASNYNYRAYNPYFTAYRSAPLWQRLRTSWGR